MSRAVHVLGTDHRYQTRDTDFSEVQHNEFAQFVADTCRAHGICAIAEENNTQALAEASVEESVPQRIAHTLGLTHQHCDPDRATRTKLGIRQENDIRAQAFLERWSETIVQEKLEASHRVRERYWLQQIIALNMWPVLFVCGADHSKSLLSLLPEHDVQVELVASDWGTSCQPKKVPETIACS
ncbi:MAG: hypothetical protein EWM73_02004 [Nitrospira sp.]|nr:MAG: hypothetical protein EWM73_02004 [Nitrospira sp.]